MRRNRRKFCIIGMGSFGRTVAETLHTKGHEVTIIDSNKDKIQRCVDLCTIPLLGDASSKEFLDNQDLGSMDAVVVATGDDSYITTLITLILQELNIERVVVKTKSENHSRILEKIGATDIILPEIDSAKRTAYSLSNNNILEYIPLTEKYSITEMRPPLDFIGKTLTELNLRRRFNINIIAIKSSVTAKFDITPDPEYRITEDDLLIVLGAEKYIEAILTVD